MANRAPRSQGRRPPVRPETGFAAFLRQRSREDRRRRQATCLRTRPGQTTRLPSQTPARAGDWLRRQKKAPGRRHCRMLMGEYAAGGDAAANLNVLNVGTRGYHVERLGCFRKAHGEQEARDHGEEEMFCCFHQRQVSPFPAMQHSPPNTQFCPVCPGQNWIWLSPAISARMASVSCESRKAFLRAPLVGQ